MSVVDGAPNRARSKRAQSLIGTLSEPSESRSPSWQSPTAVAKRSSTTTAERLAVQNAGQLKADRIPRVPYENTTLDRAKLERYARKVAGELGGTGPTTNVVESVVQVPVTTTRWFGLRADTKLETRTVEREVTTPGSRWYLDRRVIEHKTKHGRGDYNEEHTVESYYLEWNGGLVVDWESWEDGISGGRYWQGGKEVGNGSPMSDFTILLFDHDFLNPSRRVWAHAKGVGLSLRLKKLLEARPSSR